MFVPATSAQRSVPTSSGRQTRRVVAAAAVLLLTIGGTAACGSSDASSGSTDGGSLTSPKVIDVAITGDSVTPNGERVDVAVGQPVTLHVTADAPGEIHVHSNPEQELEYDTGVTDVKLTPITTPGTIDVESHTLDKVIVQLEVS